MILEGIVTTIDEAGALNVAPMGPSIEPGSDRFVLKPFRSSNTYRNLSGHGEGVLHVTDDVLLFARSAIGNVVDVATRPAERVRGRILTDCCHYLEFRVTCADERDDRVSFSCEAVHGGRVRDFFGFNRAKHAALETAILATRAEFLPPDELLGDLARYRVIVAKTGGPAEVEAFALLESRIRAVARRRGIDVSGTP